MCGFLLSGCQLGYYVKSAYNHFSMMSSRESIEKVLADPKTDDKTRAKLQIAKEAHEFALAQVHLKETKNYTTYVDLHRPYVSWVISAAPRWQMEHHYWSYPFVGKMPYKGFASEADAKDEQAGLEKENLDTFMRGVSAYSTLGWFQDSVLSSMLKYSDHDLVNTIIHETVHTTLYIKNSSDFNERLAVFVGNKATEQFYLGKEGPQSPTVQKIRDENEDDKTFSAFIGPEIEKLRLWYKDLPPAEQNPDIKRERLKKIQEEFVKSIKPKMKTASHSRFSEIELNNARLLYYKTYLQDLSDFEALYAATKADWTAFFQCAKALESEKNPEQALKDMNAKVIRESASTCR